MEAEVALQFTAAASLFVPSARSHHVALFQISIVYQIAQLLDLVIMDMGCLRYAHNLVAASAIYHMASEPLALSVSGLRREDIADCVEWMEPFAAVLHEVGTLPARHFPEIPEDDQHNIQVRPHLESMRSFLREAMRRVMKGKKGREETNLHPAMTRDTLRSDRNTLLSGELGSE